MNRFFYRVEIPFPGICKRLLAGAAGICLTVLLTAAGTVFPQQKSTKSNSDLLPRVIGELRLHEFSSKIFGNTRTIRVLLPPGYDNKSNKKKRYPVLYLNDGQNLFDTATSLFNPLEWQVDETVDRLITQKKIVPLIIVGIDTAGKRQRPNEYLPYEDKFLRPPVPLPEGKKYPQFLIEEVMPFINEKYRTSAKPSDTGIGGSSYGAVAALYTVITKPGVFGRLLLESPSLYISDARLIKDSEKVEAWSEKIYIGIGTNEGGRAQCQPGDLNREAVQDVLRLEKVFKNAGLDNRRLKTVVEDCAVHDEAAWAKRFPSAVEFLFGKNQ
jgi:predicted alpha/beta superfamily hydrolase